MLQNFRLWLTSYPWGQTLLSACLFLLLARSLRGFSSDIYFGNMVNFLKISHTILCCPPPQTHNFPGIFKSQSCWKWTSSHSSITIQVFYASTAFQFVLKNPCSTKPHLLLVGCLSTLFWRWWFCLCPPFSNRSKKNCWFSVFSAHFQSIHLLQGQTTRFTTCKIKKQNPDPFSFNQIFVSSYLKYNIVFFWNDNSHFNLYKCNLWNNPCAGWLMTLLSSLIFYLKIVFWGSYLLLYQYLFSLISFNF